MPGDKNDPANPENRVRTRDAQRELRRLLLRWDPIGVATAPEAADEYDCLISPLLHELHAGASPAQISQLLTRELAEHFEMTAVPSREDRFAAELVGWWHARATDADV